MADKKITALTDLGTGIAAVDLFHIIDDPSGTPVNKKISVANVFNHIPTYLGLDGTAQTISNRTDAVNVTTSITLIDTNTAGGTHAGTFADGSNGQLKIIIMKADGGDSVITPSNFKNGSTITLNDAGDSIILIFTDSNWHIIANTGCTIA